jgi:hypothetical protein
VPQAFQASKMDLPRSKRRRRLQDHHGKVTTLYSSILFTALLIPTSLALPQIHSGFPASMSPTITSNTNFVGHNKGGSGVQSVGGMTMGSPPPTVTGVAPAYSPISSLHGSGFQQPMDSSESVDPADTPQGKAKNSIVNLYFLLLAIFLLILVSIYIFVRRRRIAKIRRVRSSGQSALARDVEGWSPTRTWPGSGWRGMVARTSRTSRISRDEGLDERGEAPPPYNPGRGEEAERALREAEATALARLAATTGPLLRSQDSATVEMTETPTPEPLFRSQTAPTGQVGIPLRSMVRWSASASLISTYTTTSPPDYDALSRRNVSISSVNERRPTGRRRPSSGSAIGFGSFGGSPLYRMDTNEIIAGRGGDVIAEPREAVTRR